MNKKIKVHSLTGRIDFRLMVSAFRKVKSNRGAAGVDKVSIKMFEANRDDNLMALMKEMKSGRFLPKPLRRIHIPKDPRTKKTRPLGFPIVRDRVAQEVLRRLLAPIFEPMFHHCSFGFIRNRNCHMAVEKLLEMHCAGYKAVLDADIKGFLDLSSQCTPAHEGSSKSFCCTSITLIRKPFLFPRQRWTASRSPRFTRCNTV